MKKSAFLGVIGVWLGMGGLVFYNGVIAAQPQLDLDVIAEQRKAKEENARQILKSREWIIYLAPQDSKGKPETDVLTFTEEGKIISKNLIAKGYNASNFALTLSDGGAAVWETMQSDENQNLAFLRGELRGDEMTGSIVMKSVKGIGTTYSYSTMPPFSPETEEAPVKKSKKGK